MPSIRELTTIAWPRLLVALVVFSTAALVSLSASSQQAAQNPRIALVIGNATYRDQALATTANDAGLVAQTLQAAGFDVVGARDLDGQSLRTAFRDFLDKASSAGPDMQSFVYLAGRGVQYNGDNYFVPVDAQIRRDADVPIDAVKISDFAHALAQTPGKARIIVLDAARVNPYAAQGPALAPGLALVDPEPGELIAFNAAPGTLAGDEQGPYGVYGKTLAGAMRQGGVPIEDVFDQTRVSVNQLAQGALIPWSASKLTEPYYVFERAPDAPPPPAAPAVDQPIASLPPDVAYSAAVHRNSIEGYRDYLAAYPHSAQARRVRAILAARREAAFWRRSVDANTADAYWTYLRIYPRGPHVRDAGRRLEMISSAFEPPPDFRPMNYDDLPPPPPDEGFYEDQPFYAFDAFGPPPPPPPPAYFYAEDDDWRDLPPPPPPSAIGYLPVLPIAIPLVIGAVAFQHYNAYHRNGIAPANLPQFQPPPPAPMPLPANVVPVRPPGPIPIPARQTAGERVKPLPPIGAPAMRGANAPGNAPSAQPVGGNPPAAPRSEPAGSSKATQGAPVPPMPNGNPAAAPPPPTAGGKPSGTTTGAAPPQLSKPALVPAGTPPATLPAAEGGKSPTAIPGAAPHVGEPLPTPAGTPPSAARKPATVAPASPVSTTPPAAGKPPTGAPVVPTGAQALPVPQAPATAVVPNPAPLKPQAPGPKPSIAPAGAAPANRSAPTVPAPTPPPVVHAPAPPPAAPVVRVPPPAAPAPAVHTPPPPAAPVVHAPPPAPPAPVVHAPPAPAAPVVHAPPPPPPAPVVHAPPPPAAPVAHGPPPAAPHGSPCGAPGQPACPK